MSKSYFIIPIFLPELACPNQCIFCNQNAITGVNTIYNFEETYNYIKQRLNFIPNDAKNIQIAYYGGNFSGIKHEIQAEFLQIAQHFVDSGGVNSIRLSTRPDYINEDILNFYKKFKIENIELGAQTFNNDTLTKIERGHTAEDTIKASNLINKYGYKLGLQMMIGLPNENIDSYINTANKIVSLKATETRIYPLQVIKNTKLEELYKDGKYVPLAKLEIINALTQLVEIFEQNNITILRIGLHPISEAEKHNIIAGESIKSLKQIVYTQIWKRKLQNYLNSTNNLKTTIYVSSSQYPNAIGFKRQNIKNAVNQNIKFKIDNKLTGLNYEISYS